MKEGVTGVSLRTFAGNKIEKLFQWRSVCIKYPPSWGESQDRKTIWECFFNTLKSISKNKGIYFIINLWGEVVYIGQSVHVGDRILQHHKKAIIFNPVDDFCITEIQLIEIPSQFDLDIMESYYINIFKPKFNTVHTGKKKFVKEKIIKNKDCALTLGIIKNHFAYITQNIARIKISVAAYLAECYPVNINGELLTIVAPYPTMRDNLKRKETQVLIEREFSEYFKQPIHIWFCSKEEAI